MPKPTVLSILSFITLLISCIVFSSCDQLEKLLIQAAEEAAAEDTSAADAQAEDTGADAQQ